MAGQTRKWSWAAPTRYASTAISNTWASRCAPAGPLDLAIKGFSASRGTSVLTIRRAAIAFSSENWGTVLTILLGPILYDVAQCQVDGAEINRTESSPRQLRAVTAQCESSMKNTSRSQSNALKWYRSSAFELIQFLVLLGALLWLVVHGAQSMGYQWKWEKVPRYIYRVIDGELIWGPLMKGLFVTLDIAWKAGLIGMLLGLVAALLRLSRSVVGRAMAWTYIELVRNTPLLVQVLIVYFIIAATLGIPRLWAGILCLALYEGSFVAEIIRGAIVAVKKGQREAGLSLGFGPFDLYRDIILPQAVPLMLPPLGGIVVNLVKHSAIVSVIAVFDLTTQARTVISDTFMAFEIWLTVAGMYLVITVSLSLGVLWLEKRYRHR